MHVLYFFFISAEAVNNMCGLGFNGYDENGKAKWDRVTNVDILKLEVRVFLSRRYLYVHWRYVFLCKILGFYPQCYTFPMPLCCFTQFATSMKQVLDNWNICTVLWLRR